MGLEFDPLFDNSEWSDAPDRKAADVKDEHGKESKALKSIRNKGKDNRKAVYILEGAITIIGGCAAFGAVAYMLWTAFQIAFVG